MIDWLEVALIIDVGLLLVFGSVALVGPIARR